jgi:drug/metabolite transporter (DMT)-like permease
MKISWLLIGLIILNFILATAGDTSAKMWAVHPGQKWFLITILLSALTSLSFMLIIRQSGLAIGSTIMFLLTMVSAFLIGYLVFKEQVSNGQWVGILLALTAVAFLTGLARLPN